MKSDSQEKSAAEAPATVPESSDERSPDYEFLIKQKEFWWPNQAALILLGSSPESTNLDGVSELEARLTRAIEEVTLPRALPWMTINPPLYPCEVLLWAYWAGLDLPPRLRDYATKLGEGVTRHMGRWLERQTWARIVAVNLSRGYPPECLIPAYRDNFCLSSSIGSLIDFHRATGDVHVNGDGSVDRDDFLIMMLKEGCWLPPPLRIAAEAAMRRRAGSGEPAVSDAGPKHSEKERFLAFIEARRAAGADEALDALIDEYRREPRPERLSHRTYKNWAQGKALRSSGRPSSKKSPSRR